MILSRWSPRAFADKVVSSGGLKKVFAAASWAASSYNDLPWRFFVGQKDDATYQKIFDALVEFNQNWAKRAPVLILSVASKKFAHSGHPNHCALHDRGAAKATLSLAATALGLHLHSMAGFTMNVRAKRCQRWAISAILQRCRRDEKEKESASSPQGAE